MQTMITGYSDTRKGLYDHEKNWKNNSICQSQQQLQLRKSSFWMDL